MDQTFRIRKSALRQGITLAALFLVLGVAVTSPFVLVHEPPGSAEVYIRVFLVGFIACFCGALVLIGVHAAASYTIARFSVKGQGVWIRTVFQNVRFEEIEMLRWGTPNRPGRLVFSGEGRRAILDTHWFQREDRLKIIRLLRALVPEEKQEAWPMFCHRTALPSRDGVSASARERAENLTVAPNDMVFVSRKRYDRVLTYMIPTLAMATAAIWFEFGLRAAMAIPVAFLPLLLLMRFSTGKNGYWDMRMRAHPLGKMGIFTLGWLILVIAAGYGLPLFGVQRNTAAWVAIAMLVPEFPAMVLMVVMAEKQMNEHRARALPTALRLWEDGERGQVTNS